jgi:hypothetical protein
MMVRFRFMPVQPIAHPIADLIARRSLRELPARRRARRLHLEVRPLSLATLSDW